MKLPVSILSCLVICALFAGERPRMCLNEGWTGVMTPEAGEVRTVASIDLPHNWDDYHGYRQHYHGKVTCDIKRGDTVITEAMVSGDTVTLPTDCVVNAGVYTFCFSIPDDSISMREMK